MEIETIRAQFISSSERFVRKVESFMLGDDPSRARNADKSVRELMVMWEKTLVVPLDELARINDTFSRVETIMQFAAYIDVNLVARRTGVSDTSRGVMAQLQRDILDFGSKFMSMLSAQTNAILKNKAPLDIAKVELLLIERAMSVGIGPVFAKVARRYAPLMHPEALRKLREILLVHAIDKMFEVTRTPIDPARPIYEQVLTSGSLVPLTQSMSRKALFEIFGDAYDMKQNISDNLARLADKFACSVVLSSKIAPRAIEFDSRGLFDFAYVKRNDLIMPKFLGLCEKAIARYNTIHVLSESKATIPTYFYHQPREASSRTLILESLTGNLFRIIGPAICGQGKTRVGEEYLTDNDYCRFLVEGQSTRADQYNRRAEDAIFANGQSDEVQSITAMFQTTEANSILADSLRSRITIRMRDYLRDKIEIPSNQISELFDMCVNALQDVMPSIKSHLANLSSQAMFFSRLFKLAGKLSSFLEPFAFELRTADHGSRERIVNKIMQNAADEELFTIDETLNMTFLSKRTK